MDGRTRAGVGTDLFEKTAECNTMKILKLKNSTDPKSQINVKESKKIDPR